MAASQLEWQNRLLFSCRQGCCTEGAGLCSPHSLPSSVHADSSQAPVGGGEGRACSVGWLSLHNGERWHGWHIPDRVCRAANEENSLLVSRIPLREGAEAAARGLGLCRCNRTAKSCQGRGGDGQCWLLSFLLFFFFFFYCFGGCIQER